jgi:hypothetical protein
MGSKSDEWKRTVAKKREQRRKITSVAVIVGGVALLIGSGLMLRTGVGSGTASFEYTQDDVSFNQPFLAVHEMEAGPPIPFLPKDGPQPKIAVNEDFYNFGSLGAKDVVIREFAVTNLGNAPLTISRAYTTCGCTTAEFTASVLLPGEVSLITLRFDAGYHDTAGQTVRRGIIIENNDPDHPSTEIWVQASVRSNT